MNLLSEGRERSEFTPRSDEDVELILAKRRLAELQARKIGLLKGNGILSYKPYGRQDSFHRAADYKWRLWEAGNRGGKSTGGCAEDISWLLGHRPFYPESDPARYVGIPQGRKLKGLVVCNDWKKVGEVFTSKRGEDGKIWKLIPQGFVKHTTTNSEGVIDLIECTNGSTLHFTTVRSWMTNPGSVESVDHDFVHFDEPLPKAMFKGISRGLIDRAGKGWFTLTPKTEPWIHLMFFPSRRIKDDLVIDGRKWAQKSSTTDNPFLPPEEIEDFKSTLTKDEIDCLIHGIPLALSGLVFKEFDYNKHVLNEPLKGWKSFSEPPASATIYVAIDPHPQTPHHVLFLALLPPNVWVCYDEIFLHCGIKELGRMIKDRIGSHFCPGIICDPLAFIEHPDSRVASYAEDFFSAGLMIRKASKDRSGGILRARQRLTEPNGFYLSPQLEEMLFEFETHAWDEKQNKPKDENDHAMENFGRLALENPQWLDPESNKSAPVSAIEIDRYDLNLPDVSLDLD